MPPHPRLKLEYSFDILFVFIDHDDARAGSI
jgi:hypothetical protein